MTVRKRMHHGGDIYGKQIELDYSVNLRPLGIPGEVLRSVQKAADRYGTYPDPAQTAVRRCIAETEGVGADCVLAGNGASELILAVVRAIGPGSAWLFEPAYGGYEYALSAAGCGIRHVITESGTIDPDVCEETGERPDVVFVCDPSNPMGRNEKEGILRDFLDRMQETGTRVILDESFYLMSDRAGDPAARWRGRLIEEYDHLYLLRSMTKILAAPGIRMGVLLSSPENIAEVKRKLPEWNLSVTAEEAIKAGYGLLADPAFIGRDLAVIRRERAFLMRELSALDLLVCESNAPYLCFRGPDGLGDSLLNRGILIRDCSDYYGLEKGTWRIAVKDHGSNVRFCQIVREVLRSV